MEFNKKAIDRDNARVYRSIEENARFDEMQGKLEEDQQQEEMERIRREREMCQTARSKAEQMQQADKEKQKKRQEEMMKERKQAYDRIVMEAMEKRERLETEVLYLCKQTRIKGTGTEKPQSTKKEPSLYFLLFSFARRRGSRSSIKNEKSFKSKKNKRYYPAKSDRGRNRIR